MDKRFSVFSASELIGYSELESGDPPMGVVFGKFFPNTGFEKIREGIAAGKTGGQPNFGLTVQLLKGDTTISEINSQSIYIDGIENDNGDDWEISILGISYPLYEELFPVHISEYRNRFNNVD